MNKICNYPNQDDYETEEEFNKAQEMYWMELDRQYDEWKDEQLEKEKRMLVEISVDGCDDSTVVTMEMSNYEYNFLQKLAELVNKTSSYICMPTIKLTTKD